jgi:hypothetical protein
MIKLFQCKLIIFKYYNYHSASLYLFVVTPGDTTSVVDPKLFFSNSESDSDPALTLISDPD